MTEHTDNHHPVSDAADHPRVSLRTELLRAAADGELTAAQSDELDLHLASHPDDRSVIEFERRLRASVKASALEPAPVALRDRVAASYEPRHGHPHDPAPIPIRARHHRRLPQTVRWLAVAASVAIIAGGALVTLRPSGTGFSGGAPMTASYRASLVSFISSQHQECEINADLIGTRFKTTRLDDVPAEFSRVLGTAPDVGHIEDYGFKLLGAGPCAVPGRGKSVRMVLELTDPARTQSGHGALVSLHIQQDTGELNLEPGKTFRLVDENTGGGSQTPEIFVWRRDGFVYFLISRSEPAMQMARAALGAPEPSGTI